MTSDWQRNLNPNGPSSSPSPLRQYVDAAWRRRRVIAVCLVIPVVAAVAYGATKPDLFQSSAQVVLSRQNLANALTGTPDPTSQASDFLNIVRTQAQVARSPMIAQAVVRAVPEAHLTYKQFLEQSQVETVTDADLLNFGVQNDNPRLAVRLAQSYADQFVKYKLRADTASLGRALSQLETRISELNRDPTRNARLISPLTTSAQQLRTMIALQTSNANVTAKAMDAEQIAPKPGRYAALALLMGILLAVAATAAYENLDTRVRDPKEIEDALATSFLSYVPPPDPALDGRLLMLARPNGPNAEAFRALRSAIEFAILDRHVKTLMVTSAVEAEGKSTTVANLAITMARAGSRVILVDLDFRKPSLTEKFGLTPGPGMTDVALGRHALGEVMEDIPLSGMGGTDRPERGSLQFLRPGQLPPDPGEFVHSPSVLNIVRELSEMADIVLLDTPPVLRAGDAAALGVAVDAVLLVARLPQLRRPALASLARVVQASPALLLGFVVTGAGDLTGNAYGYGYGYGYGYQSDSVDSVVASAAAE